MLEESKPLLHVKNMACEYKFQEESVRQQIAQQDALIQEADKVIKEAEKTIEKAKSDRSLAETAKQFFLEKLAAVWLLALAVIAVIGGALTISKYAAGGSLLYWLLH